MDKVTSEAKSKQAEDENFFLECEKHMSFWLLIFVGGFYGAYTYSVRGGVFCNAQTANVVLLSMAIGNRDISRALYLLIPISSYFLGAMLSEILAKDVKKYKLFRWDTVLVGIEMLVVIVLGALPKSAPDQICQVALNFICSMQFNTFRQNEGIPMATTFVTNHIRQVGSNLVKAIRDDDEKAKKRSKGHFIMIIMFLLGGILSTVLCYYFDVRAIWGAFFILAILFVRLIVADTTYEKELLKKVPRGH
ncbi:MAG: DUF1275 domain-containing protein [Lachnospiraceae bacterium]|nr:DUF1275 domain-containing protein [Lachnospiraceae bacterium]